MTLNNIILLFFSSMLVACNSSAPDANDDGWRVLSEGENLDNWTVKLNGHEVGDNYADTFRAADGVIQVNYEDYDEFGERFGHLFFNEPFSSYHLKFEYRLTEQWLEDAPSYAYRNSGVMFHSQDPNTILKDQDWPISVEYQILGADSEGNSRPTGNMCSPGTDVFFEGELDDRHCIRSSSEHFDGEEWVEGEIIVDGDTSVIHKVNGKKVLEYTRPHIGGGVVGGFDPDIKVDGKPLKEGYIALQSEGQGVEFRDIKIKMLD